MPQGSGSITKNITKKTLTRHPPEDRFEGLMKAEFFNGAFRKSLMLSHESPVKEPLFPWITG